MHRSRKPAVRNGPEQTSQQPTSPITKKTTTLKPISPKVRKKKSTTSSILTVTARAMGSRVKPSDRDKVRNARTQSLTDHNPTDPTEITGKDEIKSILPQIMTGTGKNRKLVEVGTGSSIYTTEKIPILNFGASTNSTNDYALASASQYQRERRKQDDQLMWEREAKQITKLQTELEQSKRDRSNKIAKNVIPGVEMTPELLAKSKELVIRNATKSNHKKPSTTDSNHQPNDHNEMGTDDYDQMLQSNSYQHQDNQNTISVDQDEILAQYHHNKVGGNKSNHKQHEPEAIEERLSLKEQELVKKIRMRAFQSNTSIHRYCNQNGIEHLLPLFDMKPAQMLSTLDPLTGKLRTKSSNIDDDNDDDDYVDDNTIRKINELANISDGDADDDQMFSDYNNGWDDGADIDIDTYDGDLNDTKDGNNNIENINRQQIHKKIGGKTTIELGNLTKPSIFVQAQPQHTSQFQLSTFDQLQQSTARGVRLNPKKFLPKQSPPVQEALTAHEKRSTFVHRTRPMLPDGTWVELGLNPAISGKLQSALITNPTATQKLVIPYLIRKFNPRTGRVYVPPTVAIQDYTGSGKTYAYGLPLLSNIEASVASRMPPPSVIAAIRALQGTKIANPPPLETESTPLDEVDPNVRVIQYQDNQTFNNPLGIDPQTDQKVTSKKNKLLHFGDDFDQEDIADNDVETLISTRGFIDRLANGVDLFSLTPDEWEQHVFQQEKIEQDAAQARKLSPVKRIPVSTRSSKQFNNDSSSGDVPDQSMTGGLTIDASMFNSRVYSLEAIRLRRKKQIRAHLKKIFPFVRAELLDPDAPQSTLQSIIVVPTKELALQITKEMINANPTVFTSEKATQYSHQLYGDKSIHVGNVKGKAPVHIRMATGQVDPVLLASLGVFLHKGVDKPNTDAELSPYNKKRAYNANTGEEMGDHKMTLEQQRQHAQDQEKMRPHPFVDFGKGHKYYKEDQAEYRKVLRDREKDHVLRVMRLRERQMQGEKLSKFDVNDIESLDSYESKRQKALDLGLDWDPEKEYAKTVGMNTDGFDQATAEMMDGDNDDMLGGQFDFEEDPHKLMQMDDASLMKKLDLFRTDFTKHKMFRSLSQQEQREFKSRIATIMTKNHLQQQDSQRAAALKAIHQPSINGRPTLTFVPAPEQHKHPTIREENKEHYMKEVSELLMEQMGGEQGDFIEVVREKQPHVIVGTPTTIVNLIKSGAIQLPSTGLSPNQLKSMVFDECDHLARNENSLDHHSLLELLSLPTDQSVFVSASMTRDNARLLTRLGRRQDLFINNKKPQVETVTNMLTLPRPNYKSLPTEVTDQAYEDAFKYAQDRVNEFNLTVENDPIALNEIVLSSPRAKKERLKILSDKLEDPEQRPHLVDKIVDTMYKQHFIPLVPDHVYHESLQNSISRGKLSYTTTSDEYGEVLFLSAEDYKAESQPSPQQLLTAGTEQFYDANSLPIPPFVKQYYIAPPRLADIQQKLGGKEDFKRIKSNSYLKRVLKDNLALDLICQLKLRPLKVGDDAKVSFTSNAYKQLLESHEHVSTAQPHDTPHPAQTLVNNQTTQQRDSTELIGQLGTDLAGDGQNLNFDHVAQHHPLPSKRPSKNPTASSICPGTILVFFNPRREEDMVGLFRQLKETGLNVGLYCGLSDRHQKHEVLTRNDKLDVILTNDSLSRGIDFKHLSMVINVDPPRATTTFIHRSGRVGRVGGRFRKAATVVNIVDMVPDVPNEPDSPTTTTATTTNNNNSRDKTISSTNSDQNTVSIPDIPKQTATYSLLKHAERTNVTVNPWPFVVTHNISRVYLRSLKAIVASDTEKQGIKRHLDRKRKTEEYVKARNVKLHKKGIIQTKDTGIFDLAPGYNDSQFQPQMGKKTQSVAIHRIQAKVNEKLRSGSKGNPWIQTNEGQGKKSGHKKSLKH